MQLLPRPSSKAISMEADDRMDPTLPVILEYPVALHRHHQSADAAARARIHPDASAR